MIFVSYLGFKTLEPGRGSVPGHHCGLAVHVMIKLWSFDDKIVILTQNASWDWNYVLQSLMGQEAGTLMVLLLFTIF